MWSNLEVEVRWAPWRFSSWDTGFLADNFGFGGNKSVPGWHEKKAKYADGFPRDKRTRTNMLIVLFSECTGIVSKTLKTKHVESCQGFLWVLYVLEVIFQHDIWLGGRIISLVEICQLSCTKIAPLLQLLKLNYMLHTVHRGYSWKLSSRCVYKWLIMFFFFLVYGYEHNHA